MDGPPGELLYTAMNSGGTVSKFYRFRTPDGVIDYYDDDGNNSKKFLIRKPVRGDNVRLTSGFGVRFHPLLNTRKMHTGVDWACPHGTPIIAAGNGTIEEVGHKGYYGNYIRIRHANGYQTAYGHMSRFAQGIRARNESPPRRHHRLCRIDRAVVRSARALRSARQQPLRRSDVNSRCRVNASSPTRTCRTSRKSARGSKT